MRIIAGFFAFCAALSILIVKPANAQFHWAGAQSKSPGALQKIGQVNRRRSITVLGDSLGDCVWQGLHRYLRKTKQFKVNRRSKHSVGFTTSPMTHQLDAAFAAGRVDALVIMVGANDDRRSFFRNGRSLALFGTPRWQRLYRDRVARFMQHAKRNGVPLLWVLLPVMRSRAATKAARITNKLVIEAAQGLSHVTAVPTWALTTTPKGKYLPHFKDIRGRRRLMRQNDGMHFTVAGCEVLGRQTFNALKVVAPRFHTAATRKAARLRQ